MGETFRLGLLYLRLGREAAPFGPSEKGLLWIR